MSEASRSELYVSAHEAHERYTAHPASMLDVLDYINQPAEQATTRARDFVDAAMRGETPETLEFSYPNIDVDALNEMRGDLSDMLEFFARYNSSEMPDEAVALIRENITMRLHQVGALLLTKAQSELGPDNPLYEAISFQLGQNMREIYGTPDPDHWRGILGYRLSLLREIESREDVPDDVMAAWQYVRDALPTDLPTIRPYEPQPETKAWYRARLEERMAPARAAVAEAIEAGEVVVDESGKMDAQNTAKATTIALRALHYDDWEGEAGDESSVRVSQTNKRVLFPETKAMSLAIFDEVVLGHELDEHVARRVNGDASGEPVLGGVGCSGSIVWEEGNGVVNQVLLGGKASTQNSAFLHYLAGGLVLGIDGKQPSGRNFGQTFELVWRMNFVDAALKGKVAVDNIDGAKRASMLKAVGNLRRNFRGTDGRAPGVVYLKDVMSYYPGQVLVWQKWDHDMTLSEDERLREHELERFAKINPTRADHHRVTARAMQRNR